VPLAVGGQPADGPRRPRGGLLVGAPRLRGGAGVVARRPQALFRRAAPAFVHRRHGSSLQPPVRQRRAHLPPAGTTVALAAHLRGGRHRLAAVGPAARARHPRQSSPWAAVAGRSSAGRYRGVYAFLIRLLQPVTLCYLALPVVLVCLW